MIASDSSAYRYLSAFPAYASHLPGHRQPYVAQFRQAGIEAFSAQGFPHQRLEEWRYSNPAILNKTVFQLVTDQPAESDFVRNFTLADVWRIVLVNGRFAASLSDVAGLPEGVTLDSLSRILQDSPERVEPYLGKAVTAKEHSLIAFNNAWFSDGVFIEVAAGVKLDKPVQILHVVTGLQALAATRQIVVINENARMELIETFAGGDGGYFSVAVNECFLSRHAELSWYKLQAEAETAVHFGGVYVKQADNSLFRHQNFAFGALWARSDVHCDLQQAAACELNGLYWGNKRRHIDNHTRINHLKPRGFSREYYKGVLDQRARGVFQGRVVVSADAQQTDSQMNNRNLLLSEDAEADTKPQLEIYADDVKCSHGVTVGQLDENSIFFLQARGIDIDSARTMLTFAFANEMIDKVEIATLRNLLQAQLFKTTSTRFNDL
ncbi:MAG: Fe-S cluster assembly protein SufD [Methylomonas sp.]|jgi:Fe-S cluster assembly protein SufD